MFSPTFPFSALLRVYREESIQNRYRKSSLPIIQPVWLIEYCHYFLVTCKSFGDVILFPFPGLVVLIGRPLVVLRQPAALLALLLRFSVHQSQALASLLFVGGVVELHPAPQPSSSWATLELCWRICKTTQLHDLTNTHALDFWGGMCHKKKKTSNVKK